MLFKKSPPASAGASPANHADTLSSLLDARLIPVLESLNEGAIIYDPNFRILYFNKSAERILGLRREYAIGATITPALINQEEFRALTQVIFPTLAPIVTQISETEWPQVVDLTLENPSLRLRTVLNRITDPQTGAALGFVKTVEDRTREANILQTKNEFLDVAAHQLRTPLTAIKWTLETVGRELTSNTTLKNTVDQGTELADRSLRIVEDLLNAARIEGGQFGYQFREIELVSFVQKIVNQGKIVAGTVGIELTYVFPPEPVRLQADPERITIALSNLIDNAIKYNVQNGKVRVTIAPVPNEPYVEISVQDTGVGIPPEELGAVFKKFHRGSNVVQLQPNGSGLGLYIVKNIIKNHGGDIGVKSVVGRGTTFWFTLPTDPARIPQRETVYAGG